ncbi:MAG: 50S ribosomal protein L24 [Chlamydiales bacterium]
MGNRRLTPGDEVIVVTGNDKGKRGKIISFNKNRIVVEGVNIRKKHLRKTQENQKGQIIEIESSIHISNIMPSINGKAVKLRARFDKEGQKELYYLDEGKEVFVKKVKR